MGISEIRGTLKTLWNMMTEEFDVMDHKLLRIIAGIISFLVAGAIWFFFLRNFLPF